MSISHAFGCIVEDHFEALSCFSGIQSNQSDLSVAFQQVIALNAACERVFANASEWQKRRSRPFRRRADG